MTVSVVMPTYNRGYTIAEALESVLTQSFADFEAVVVDDGSSDDTAEVVGRFRDPRLRYIRSEVNAGHSAACNRGMREARGEWISFLDSDDLWKPDKLALEMRFASRHPEVGAIFCDLEKSDGGLYYPSFMRQVRSLAVFLARGPYPEGVVVDRRFMYLALLRESFVKPTALAFRRALLQRVGSFDEAMPSGCEWPFLIRLCEAAVFGYIDRTTAVLRVMGDATHRNERGARAKPLAINALRRERRRLRADREARMAVEWGIADVTKQLGWQLLDFGRRKDAAAAFLRGFWYTGDLGLAARAVDAALPSNVDQYLRRVVGRRGSRKGRSG